MTNGNDNAFARPASEYDGYQKTYTEGLTKREYLAVLAMQGLVTKDMSFVGYAELAANAVRQADTLIKELNKTNNENKS